MRAFRVDLNGKRICVAGVGDRGVVSTIIDHVDHGRGGTASLRVGGLFTPTEEHAEWQRLDLKVGDKVAVTVIDAESVDKPAKLYRADSKTYETGEKAYVRALAKKLGRKIVQAKKKARSLSEKLRSERLNGVRVG